MDSGNSGSLQSSSGGGDDELDAACGVGADSSSTSSPLAALLRHQGFDGGSSLIYGLQDLGTPPLASSHWCPTTTAPLPPAADGAASASPPCHGGLASSAPAAAEQTATATAQPAAPAPRGSRKRARAPRRAPTTVLTTDTSNFRAMVQEFTGIPAPPFAAAAAGARSRFDHYLFPSRSSSSSSPAAAALPQYLLRPFTHKLHPYPPPFTSSSTSPPADATIVASAAAPVATTVASGDSYQQQQLTSGLLGMQEDHSGVNSYLSFQSTLGGAHLDGGHANKYALFDDRRVAPSSATRVQDPTDFLGIVSSEGTHLHPRHGDRGDELSGLVGGCKATYSSAPPPLERNGRSQPTGASTATTTTTPVAPTAAAKRTQGVESWVCSTSE